MEFKLIRIYSKDDEDHMSDPIEVQLFDENHKLIINGNWENKVNQKIEGFFKGLNYMKAEYDISEKDIDAKSL
jgi:hypothetical protein